MDSLFQDLTPRSDQALVVNYVLHGEYKIGRVLRQSGSGFSYVAQDPDDQVVVVQELFPKHLVTRIQGDPNVQPVSTQAVFDMAKAIEQMLREGALWKSLRVAGVMQVYEVFAANSTVYVISEYHDGQSLADLIMQQGGRLSERAALENCLLALAGLKAIHDQKLVHRGIRPEQIFMDGLGKVRLVNDGFYDTLIPTSIGGTGYDAPEILDMTLSQGPWTDLYSFGAVLYTALTGQQPGPADDRIPIDTLPPISNLNSNISDAVESVAMKLMHPDPHERFQSVGEFAKVLQPIYKAVVQGIVPIRPAFLNPTPSSAIVPVPLPESKNNNAGLATTMQPAFDPNQTANFQSYAEALPITTPQATAPMPAFEPSTPKASMSQDLWSIEPPKTLNETLKSSGHTSTWKSEEAEPTRPVIAKPVPKIDGITSQDLGGRLFPSDLIEPSPPPPPLIPSMPKKKSKLPIALLGVLGVLALAGGGWWYATQNSGQIQIQLLTPDVAGAEISLRSIETGETFKTISPASLGLKEGKYEVLVFKNGFQDLNRLLTVSENDQGKQITFELSKEIPSEVSVQINSVPQGANITLDGTDTGLVTPASITMAARRHTLIYTLKGYEPVIREIEVQAATTITDSLHKAKTPVIIAPAPVAKPKPAPPNTTGSTTKPSASPKPNTIATKPATKPTTTAPKPSAQPQQSPAVRQEPTKPGQNQPSQPTTTEQPKQRKTVVERIRGIFKKNESGGSSNNNQ